MIAGASVLSGFAGVAIGVAALERSFAPYASLVANVGSLMSIVFVWGGSAREQQRAEAAMRAARSRCGTGSSS